MSWAGKKRSRLDELRHHWDKQRDNHGPIELPTSEIWTPGCMRPLHFHDNRGLEELGVYIVVFRKVNQVCSVVSL